MKALRAFHDELVDIYGYLTQVNAALMMWRGFLNERVTGSTTPKNTFFFVKGDPNQPDSTYQYRRTFAELVADVTEDGTTSVMHRRSVVVLLVASWEDRHRALIARECGLKKNDLKSDLFHDLNRYRQAILHGGGRLREDAKKMPFFRKGERVNFASGHMDSMFRMVVDELNRLGVEHYDGNPGFTFDKSMVA
ncbi:MAG: hypothetical protein F4X77_11610 [Acidobacteriia bacterium]|nr:hypothetical protein [Terriglobia bacterium]